MTEKRLRERMPIDGNMVPAEGPAAARNSGASRPNGLHIEVCYVRET